MLFFIIYYYFFDFTPSQIMWLHLVNGVYCFLPTDSCSLIWPLIYPPMFPSPPSSSWTHRDIQSQLHSDFIQTHTHTHTASRLKGSCVCKKKKKDGREKLQREAARARVSYTTVCDTCLSRSFSVSLGVLHHPG